MYFVQKQNNFRERKLNDRASMCVQDTRDKVKQCSRLFRPEKQDIKHFPRANSFYYMEPMLNYSLPHFQFSKQL